MRPPPSAPDADWDAAPTIGALAPGKLFVAGEYGVVEAGQPAVLIGVDRRLSVTLRDAPQQDLPGTAWAYVAAAREVVTALARERGRAERTFRIRTLSDLDDPDLDGHGPRKYGLGSSAAVTAAAVTALGGWYDLDLTAHEVLRLALLATWRVNPRGSGADVATAVLGGWVHYVSPDREAVAALGARGSGHDGALRSIGEVIAADWPGLHAEPLAAPSFDVLVGWTGRPASTVARVAAVRGTGLPPGFVARSAECVTALLAAVRADDLAAASDAVTATRENLLALSASVGVPLETPALTALVEVAARHGLAAKSSGAGGGDCGIALVRGGEVGATGVTVTDAVHRDWVAAGVQPLPVELAPGATVAGLTRNPGSGGGSTV